MTPGQRLKNVGSAHTRQRPEAFGNPRMGFGANGPERVWAAAHFPDLSSEIVLRLKCLLVAVMVALAPAALAVEPREMLPDPVLEARAREVSLGLRCVVCQNQSIDDSNAELAHDMRVLVRKRILAGDSDQQVTRYLVDRYGDFVTLKPPFKPFTYLLWIGPALILAAAVFAARSFYRGRPGTSEGAAPLSAAERQRLDALLMRSETEPASGPAPMRREPGPAAARRPRAGSKDDPR